MPREFGPMPPEIMKEAVKKPEAKETPLPPELKGKAEIAGGLIAGESAFTAKEKEEKVAVVEGILKREKRSPSLKSRLAEAVRILTLAAVSAGMFGSQAEAGRPGEVVQRRELPKVITVLNAENPNAYVKFDSETGKTIEEKIIIPFINEDDGSNWIREHTTFYDEEGRVTKFVSLDKNSKGEIDSSYERSSEYDTEGRETKETIVYRDAKGNIKQTVETFKEYNTEGKESRTVTVFRDAKGKITSKFVPREQPDGSVIYIDVTREELK